MFRARIPAPTVEVTGEGALRVALALGARFRLDAIAVVDPEAPASQARTAAHVELRTGDWFRRSAVHAAIEALAAPLRETYPRVNVIPFTRVDLSRSTINLTFEIERGDVRK